MWPRFKKQWNSPLTPSKCWQNRKAFKLIQQLVFNLWQKKWPKNKLIQLKFMGFVHHFLFAKLTLPYPTEPNWTGKWKITHLSGQRFLRHHFECVNHGDVAKPPGNGQSAVPILETKTGQGQETESKYLDCVSEYSSVYEQWWAHWAALRGAAVGWWCVCVPAGQPDGEACIRSARRKSGGRLETEISHPANKTIILHKGK